MKEIRWRCDREFSADDLFRRASRAGGCFIPRLALRRRRTPERSSAPKPNWCWWTPWSPIRRAITSTTWKPRISRSGKTIKNSRSRVSRSKPARHLPSNPQKHYLVLFFDNSTMDFGSQARARQAAAKFIDTNGGPNRLMAIVNFGGALSNRAEFHRRHHSG